MIRFFKSLFSGKKIQEPQPEAPYKVEAPEARVEAVNAQPIAEVVETKPAKKPAGARRAAASAKAADKAVKAKAPAKPRAKKAAK